MNSDAAASCFRAIAPRLVLVVLALFVLTVQCVPRWLAGPLPLEQVSASPGRGTGENDPNDRGHTGHDHHETVRTNDEERR